MARALVLALALAFAGLSDGGHDSAQAARARATTVGLGLREYRITVYRPTVRTGRVTINARNFGEDAHDVRLLGPNGFDSGLHPEIAPFGGTGRFTVTIKRPGRYRLICTLADHEQLGMTAPLRVKRRAKSRL